MYELSQVLSEVEQEIRRARDQWGADFDTKNTLNDWVTYAVIYLGRAASMGASPEDREKNLRKAAGLVISSLCHRDSFAPRHYERQDRPTSLPEIK